MAKAIKAPAKKSAKNKTPKSKDGLLLASVVTFLEERIADGGATTDHLQVMLNQIKPQAEQKKEFSDTGVPGTTRVL